MTIRELAKIAKVSPAAVSLVLNGKAEGQICREKQERIRALVEELHFVPNMAAQELRGSKNRLVGVLMPVPGTQFYGDMICCLQNILADHGFTSLFAFWKYYENMENVYSHYLRQRADGIIAWENPETEKHSAIPTVTFYGEGTGADDIRWDDAYLADTFVDYFVSRGIRKIGMAAYFHDHRFQCVMESMRRRGLEIREEWFLRNPDFSDTYLREALGCLEEWPDAFIHMNDASMIDLPGILLSFGRTKKCETAVFWNAFRTPGLASFALSPEELSGILVRRLLHRMEHPDASAEHILLKPKFIASTMEGIAL